MNRQIQLSLVKNKKHQDSEMEEPFLTMDKAEVVKDVTKFVLKNVAFTVIAVKTASVILDTLSKLIVGSS